MPSGRDGQVTAASVSAYVVFVLEGQPKGLRFLMGMDLRIDHLHQARASFITL